MRLVFLDTNVLLDFVLCRDGADCAEMILQMGVAGRMDVCTSLLSMANVAYIARKGRTSEQLCSMMDDLTSIVRTLPMDEGQLRNAIVRPVADFEDMLQYQCALACGCDAIVTRNTKHFGFSELPVYTPQEFSNL